jgi:hypothetical protein
MLSVAHIFNRTDAIVNDVAVVMPTIGRLSILDALQSIFDQVGVKRIQVLIGVDNPAINIEFLTSFLESNPTNFTFVLVNLPWSTSIRHGGLHLATDGGSLRAMLSLMANARYVTYLDDDNTWAPDHLAKLLNAVEGKTWAFSQRYLIDEESGENFGQDFWHSVGVDKGDFAPQGGFVDTNCLMVDVVKTAPVIGRWASSGSLQPGLTADRFFFAGIRKTPFGEVSEPTVFYKIRRTNVLHRYIRGEKL